MLSFPNTYSLHIFDSKRLICFELAHCQIISLPLEQREKLRTSEPPQLASTRVSLSFKSRVMGFTKACTTILFQMNSGKTLSLGDVPMWIFWHSLRYFVAFGEHSCKIKAAVLFVFSRSALASTIRYPDTLQIAIPGTTCNIIAIGAHTDSHYS